MIGLFWKDVLLMRNLLKVYLIAMALYAVMLWQDMMSASFIFSSAGILIAIQPLSLFVYDEQAKWNRYAMSLPVGPRAVVGARYLFVLGLFLTVFAAGLACSAVLWLTQKEDLLALALALIVSLSIQILLPAILIPICYKSGWEQARIILCVLLVVPFVALVLLYRLNLLDLSFLYTPSGLMGLAVLLPLGSLAAMLVSYLISCRIAAGKEY